MPHLTTIEYLKLGDLFYFLSDKKKYVWEVVTDKIRISTFRGLKFKTRLVVNKNPITNITIEKRHSKMSTSVVLLRNILDNENLRK
jgi:hypothetical protein